MELIIILLIVIFDQAAKYWAYTYLKILPYQTIPIIKDVFHLTYTENRGAAFSILQNQRWFFIIITIAFIISAAYYLLTHKYVNMILKISLSLIVAGAIGNLIDRIRCGYVVDFLDFRLINFPIFNVADCAVVVGSIILGYYLLFVSEKDIRNGNINSI